MQIFDSLFRLTLLKKSYQSPRLPPPPPPKLRGFVFVEAAVCTDCARNCLARLDCKNLEFKNTEGYTYISAKQQAWPSNHSVDFDNASVYDKKTNTDFERH